MAKRIVALALAVGLVGAGLWVSERVDTPQIWLYGAGLIGLVGLAAEGFLEPARAPESPDQRRLFLLWVAPGLLVVSGLWLVRTTSLDSLSQVCAAVAALAGVLLLGVGASLRPGSRFHRPGRFVANLVVYLLVFLLFALIYHTKERSLITATATGLVALLAALEILRSEQGLAVSGWPVAALVALIVAETTWALNYWPAHGLGGGAMLLLTFYVFGGLLLAVREGGLDRQLLVEYGVVGVVGLVAVTWAMA